MITIDSSPTRRFGPGAVKSLPMTGNWLSWNRQFWNELRLFVRESRLAPIALAIIVAVIVLVGLQMLGMLDFVAGWSVLRNVSGWVGPTAAIGAAGAAAAAGAGGPGDGVGASGGSRGVSGSGDRSPDGSSAPPRHQESPGGYTTFQDDGSYSVHDPNGRGGFHTTTYVPGGSTVEHWWDRSATHDGPTAATGRHSENEAAHTGESASSGVKQP